MASIEPYYSPIPYAKWNDALCDYFFSSSTNKVVYLYTNERVIIDVGSTLNLLPSECISSFCNAVRSYVSNVHELFLLSYKRGVRWYTQGAVGYPPFVGVLALCVLAATKMEKDDAEHIGGGNYYYRLRQLLNLTDGKGMPAGFEQTVGLWKILLKWQRDNKGRFGYTYSFAFPGIPYSGYPRSQCLIRDTERAILYDFFEWARYERDSNLSPSIVAKDLDNYLSSRSCRLNKLFFHKMKGMREAIVNMVIEEFKRWEPDYDLEAEPQNKIQVSVLLEFAGSVFARAITLSLLSAPVYREEKAVSANGFEYRNGYYVREIQNIDEIKTDLSLSIGRDILLYKGKGIIVFRKAGDKGLQGWLSREDIAPQQEHLILYSLEHKATVQEWINVNSLQGQFSEVKDGFVPDGWELIRILIPEQISTMHGLAGIKYGEKISISLLGGLKIGYNRWLLGFPPVVSISAPPKSTLMLNGVPVLCLTHGSALADLRDLMSSPGNYELEVEGKKSHFQVVNAQNYESSKFEPSPFHKFTLDNGVQVGISGMYLYHNAKSLPKPCIRTGKRQVILTGEGRVVERIVPESVIKCEPFVRPVRSLDVSGLQYPLIPQRPIDCFVEYLHLRGHGNWDSFLQGIEGCFGTRDPFIAYRIRRNLSELGMFEFRHETPGSNRFRWYSIPATAYILPLRDYAVALSGSFPMRRISSIVTENSRIRALMYEPKSPFQPTTVYLTGETLEDIYDYCAVNHIRINSSTDYFAFELVRSLPTIRQLVEDYSVKCSEPLQTISFDGWDTNQHRWQSGKYSLLKRYRLGYGRKVVILDTETGTLQTDADIGKIYLAAKERIQLFFYSDYRLSVRKEYFLPELYSRALIACSGQCPIEGEYYRTYVNVPGELALAIAFRIGTNLF